jgi:hypothetical protein
MWELFGIFWWSKLGVLTFERSQVCVDLYLGFFQRFFIGHISAHKPSFQLSFGGKEDLVVLYILVEVDWHLV